MLNNMNDKIVIVMPYFNRKLQTIETIKSITRTKHNNYVIIIVDDCSTEKLDYGELKDIVGDNVELYILSVDKLEKDWNNPVIVLNKGIFKAMELEPKIIILQNSEAYHYGDILKHANDNLNEKNYYSYDRFNIKRP